jgi:hypothetical protein
MTQTEHANAAAIIHQRQMDAANAASAAEQTTKAAMREASREKQRVKFRRLIDDVATAIDDALMRLKNQGYHDGVVKTIDDHEVAVWPLLDEYGYMGRTEWHLLSTGQLSRQTHYWNVRNDVHYVTTALLLENTLALIDEGGDLQAIEQDLCDITVRCNLLAPDSD